MEVTFFINGTHTNAHNFKTMAVTITLLTS